MKTHFEIFDKMLEEVQQLRLDANYFAKCTSWTDVRLARMRRRCRKYEERLMRRLSEKCVARIAKCHRAMKKLLRSKQGSIETFGHVVHGLRSRCEELCAMAETPLDLEEPSIANVNCVVNVGENADGNALYCKCSQPAFRMMIACDSPGCSVGWFHCECVNASASLRSAWICAECKKKMLIK